MKAPAKKRRPGRQPANGPLIMQVHLESNGSTYRIEPESEDRVKEVFPGARGLPLVFFGVDEEEEFEPRHGPLWPLAATLLTGLTMDQIRQMAGLRLEDPGKKKVIWEWHPEATKAQ